MSKEANLTLVKNALPFPELVEEALRQNEKTCIICFNSFYKNKALEFDWSGRSALLNLSNSPLNNGQFECNSEVLVADLLSLCSDLPSFDRIVAFGCESASKKAIQTELINRFSPVPVFLYLPLCCSTFDGMARNLLVIEPLKGHDLPISSRLDLPSQVSSKPVTALAIDSLGSRLFSGGFNFSLSIWDFHTLSSTALAPLKTRGNFGGDYRIRQLTFAESLLLINDSPQARLLSKDGVFIGETPRGDMYIKDLRQTRGHVSAISSGAWNPSQSDNFITASSDGTVRFWNVGDMKKHNEIILVKDARGRMIPLTCCTFCPEGNFIWTGTGTGMLRGYSKEMLLNPFIYIDAAHESEITSVKFSHSNPNNLVTRGCDSALKIWDLRQMKEPLHQIHNLPCFFEETNIACTQSAILTGTSMQKGESSSRLEIFDSTTFERREPVIFEGASVIAVEWCQKINQIFCGLSNGIVSVLWDDLLSDRGVKQAIYRQPSTKKYVSAASGTQSTEIYAPLAEEDSEQKPASFKRKAIAVKGPQAPVAGHGSHGKIGTNATARFMNTVLNKEALAEDPREALLRVAERAKNEPFWCTPAYAKTQPSAIFSLAEDEESPPKAKKLPG